MAHRRNDRLGETLGMVEGLIINDKLTTKNNEYAEGYRDI